MELDVGQLVIAILGLLGIGGAATEGGRRVIQGRREKPEPEPAQARETDAPAARSYVSKSEARELADAAAAQAAKDAQTVATMKALQSSIEAHEARDTERFGATERRAAEQHGALMGELARLHAAHEQTRERVHEVADAVASVPAEMRMLHERIADTRRQAGIDTHPGFEPSPLAKVRRR